VADEGTLQHSQFVEQLLRSIPEVGNEVRENYDDNGELLLHLLMADLLRAAVRFFHAGDIRTEQRLLRFIDRALREGDPAVVNAVLVSFIEDAGAGPGETRPFIASWPAGLRLQLDYP
jgi:hypothetical protein